MKQPVSFYVVRHGQTLFNVMGKVQGWCDTPLTEEGMRGAELLGREFSSIDFVAAFSSDSGRAVQTLDILLASRAEVRHETYVPPEPFLAHRRACGIAPAEGVDVPFPLAHDRRLREWCYGDLEGEPTEFLHATLSQGFGEELSFEEHNRRLPEVAGVIADADCSGRAERFDCIEQRVRSFFEDVGDAVYHAGGGNVLVVTHSFVVRSLVYLVDPTRVNDPAKIPNVSVTRLNFDGEVFRLGVIGSTSPPFRMDLV